MTYKYQGILFSALMHGILILLFFFITINTNKTIRKELIEVIIHDQINPVINQTVRTTTIQNPSTSRPIEQPKTAEFDAPTQVPESNNIDIPQTINEYELVDITDLPESKQPRRPVSDLRASDNDVLNPVINQNIPTGTSVNYHTKVHSNINLDGFTDEIKSILGNTFANEITGDVLNRNLIKNVLPEYPVGVMKNGSVTMEFTVTPNGTVQNIQIVRGNEPEFSIISIEALKKWEFDRATREHIGRITFNFTLK